MHRSKGGIRRCPSTSPALHAARACEPWSGVGVPRQARFGSCRASREGKPSGQSLMDQICSHQRAQPHFLALRDQRSLNSGNTQELEQLSGSLSSFFLRLSRFTAKIMLVNRLDVIWLPFGTRQSEPKEKYSSKAELRGVLLAGEEAQKQGQRVETQISQLR